MSEERLKYLFERHLGKICTPVEKEELSALTLEARYEKVVKEMLEQSWEKTGIEEDMPEEKAKFILEAILKGKQQEASFQAGKLRWMSWRRITVAASIILVVGLSGYLLFFDKPAKQTEVVKTTVPKDVKAPETNRAMVTLVDGSKVYLDSVSNGQLAMQGNIKLVKLANGQIVYETASREIINEIQFNTLFNPRGSKVIDMTLSDGSRVWLNAGSSVTFPIAIVGNERKVSITGEAYFEVAHDATKPFILSKGETSIQVLGTHFNINAYDDETDIKVTLLEGLVRLTQNAESKMLKPGEQGQILRSAQNDKIRVVGNVDVEQVMAWKNGLFKFDKTDIQTMMRQAERWYDITVSYPNGIPADRFGGTLSRDISLLQFLKILEYSDVNAKIEGKVVTIKPR